MSLNRVNVLIKKESDPAAIQEVLEKFTVEDMNSEQASFLLFSLFEKGYVKIAVSLMNKGVVFPPGSAEKQKSLRIFLAQRKKWWVSSQQDLSTHESPYMEFSSAVANLKDPFAFDDSLFNKMLHRSFNFFSSEIDRIDGLSKPIVYFFPTSNGHSLEILDSEETLWSLLFAGEQHTYRSLHVEEIKSLLSTSFIHEMNLKKFSHGTQQDLFYEANQIWNKKVCPELTPLMEKLWWFQTQKVKNHYIQETHDKVEEALKEKGLGDLGCKLAMQRWNFLNQVEESHRSMTPTAAWFNDVLCRDFDRFLLNFSPEKLNDYEGYYFHALFNARDYKKTALDILCTTVLLQEEKQSQKDKEKWLHVFKTLIQSQPQQSLKKCVDTLKKWMSESNAETIGSSLLHDVVLGFELIQPIQKVLPKVTVERF